MKRIDVIILRVFCITSKETLNSGPDPGRDLWKPDPGRDLWKNMGKWQRFGVCVGREESDLAMRCYKTYPT